MKINTRCRCCLEDGQLMDMWEEYNHEGELEVYGEMLKECFLFAWLEPKDHLAKICMQCIKRLRLALSFRRDIVAAKEVMGQLLEQIKKEATTESYLSQVLKKVEIPDNIEQKFKNQEGNENQEENDDADYSDELAAEDDLTAASEMQIEYLEDDNEAEAAVLNEESLRLGATPEKAEEKTINKEKSDIPYSTKLYQNIRSILLCSNATPIRKHVAKGFACCFCEKHYTDPKDLKNHTLYAHNDETKSTFMRGKVAYEFSVRLDITDLKCVLCDKSIDNLKDLLTHLKEIHSSIIHIDIPDQIVPFKFNTEEFNCVFCDKVFRHFKSLNEHMNEHFSNFNCDICDKSFINMKTLRMHSNRHKDGEFHCNFCSKIFVTNYRKIQHERVVHRLKSRMYKCSYCNLRLCDSASRNKHEHEMHGAERKLFNCKACKSTFARLKGLKDHIQMYHMLHKPFKCKDCEKAFLNKRDFQRHEATHLELKPFQCGTCMKYFTRSHYLTTHIAKQHEVCN